MSFALPIAFAIAPNLLAETPTNQAPTGVATVKTAANLEVIKETPAQRDARIKWWREAKFGMFIHWGLYAIPAKGEWVMHHKKIPVAEYAKLATQFNPVKFNAEQWVLFAKDAGMKYIVITAKHHDGFVMYGSKVSPYNIVEATPFKRDPLKELAAACAKEGIKLGLYYSQAQDWHEPGGSMGGARWDPAQKGEFDHYLKSLSIPQLKEITTDHKPAVIWFDTPHQMTPEVSREMVQAIRSIRPETNLNSRLLYHGNQIEGMEESKLDGLRDIGVDYLSCRDRQIPDHPATSWNNSWETCMTLNGAWGYNATDHNWKSQSTVVQMVTRVASKGGNLLLNFGPTAEGEIPGKSVEIMKQVGEWLRVNGDSVYGTSGSPFLYLSWGVATRKEGTLYLHVFELPKDGKLIVPLGNQAKSATLLATGKPLSIKRTHGKHDIDVPSTAPGAADAVIALHIEGEPVALLSPTVGAKATASASLSVDVPANALDGTVAKRWRAPHNVKSAWLEVELASSARIGAFGLDEPEVAPRMAQNFTLEAWVGSEWQRIAEGKTDGHGKNSKITPVTAQKFRLKMACEKGSPGVAEPHLYRAEKMNMNALKNLTLLALNPLASLRAADQVPIR